MKSKVVKILYREFMNYASNSQIFTPILTESPRELASPDPQASKPAATNTHIHTPRRGVTIQPCLAQAWKPAVRADAAWIVYSLPGRGGADLVCFPPIFIIYGLFLYLCV